MMRIGSGEKGAVRHSWTPLMEAVVSPPRKTRGNK